MKRSSYMKKKLFVLLPLLMVSLSACNLSDLMNQLSAGDDESADNDNDNSSGNANNQNSVDDSIFDKPESLKKLMAFGKNTGFEITTVASENEGGGGTIVIGMKGNVWWEIDEEGYGTGYRLENGVCSILTYDNDAKTWSVLIANAGETQYATMFESVTNYLYVANNYFANEGFASDGTGKYAGRDVLKYKYHRAVATVSIDHEYYIDKDLGISLYQYAGTTNEDGTSWAKIETTSFKTGNDVTAISVA